MSRAGLYCSPEVVTELMAVRLVALDVGIGSRVTTVSELTASAELVVLLIGFTAVIDMLSVIPTAIGLLSAFSSKSLAPVAVIHSSG